LPGEFRNLAITRRGPARSRKFVVDGKPAGLSLDTFEVATGVLSRQPGARRGLVRVKPHLRRGEGSVVALGTNNIQVTGLHAIGVEGMISFQNTGTLEAAGKGSLRQ